MAEIVHGVSVVWFPVTDMDKAVDFYSGTLGLEVKEQQDEWSQLEANGLQVGLNARDEETPSNEGGAVLAFQPEGGIDGAVEKLKEKGIEFPGDITEHPWGRIASFHDPDGNVLQLFEPPSS